MTGYHAVYEDGWVDAVERAGRYGFDYVQIDLNVPRFHIDRLSRTDIGDIRAALGRTGRKLTLHAPGDNVSLFTDYPEIRSGILAYFRRVFAVAEQVGARHVTIHPHVHPSFRRADSGRDDFSDLHLPYYRDVLRENLEAIADFSGPVLLCVENCVLDRATAAALEALWTGGKNVYLTMDIPKLYRSGGEPSPEQESFFLKHRDRIREIHIHDMDLDGGSHLRPGTGAVDFGRFFPAFAGENVYLTIEARPVAEAAAGRDYLETRFPGTFGRNGKEER